LTVFAWFQFPEYLNFTPAHGTTETGGSAAGGVDHFHPRQFFNAFDWLKI
jgi:hypothetical protein